MTKHDKLPNKPNTGKLPIATFKDNRYIYIKGTPRLRALTWARVLAV